AATTAQRWLCIPQGDGGTWLTTDGGASWDKVNDGVHAHGNAQIYQDGPGGAVFMSLIYGDSGSGVYRSTDLGASFTKVDGGENQQAITWGSEKAVYSMFGWAAGSYDVAPGFEVANKPATSGWQSVATPAGMVQGPNSVAVTKNGSSTVFVGNMWRAGIWRYVEP
ncbi:MAG TPA: hypothetical protein VGP93_01630, partial [Polyangiaceae bacterium]|nr:hypothetical protein [Polyangiaceae bacterium]